MKISLCKLGGCFHSLLIAGLALAPLCSRAAEVAEYRQWLASNGGQHLILDDYAPTCRATIVLDAAMLSVNEVNTTIFCCTVSGNKQFTLFYRNDCGLRFAYNFSQSRFSGPKMSANARFTVVASGTNMIVNGSAKAAREFEDFVPGNGLGHLSVFAKHGGGDTQGVGDYASMKLYSMKIYDTVGGVDGVLVKDLHPCVDTDGACGLYDTVSGRIYYNDATTGSGTFSISPVEVDVNGNPIDTSALDSYPAGGPFVWDNATGAPANWTNAVNWTGKDGYPGLPDATATFGEGSSVARPTLDSQIALASITVDGREVSLSGSGAITNMTGDITVKDGLLVIDGVAVTNSALNGKVVFQGEGEVRVVGGGSLVYTGGGNRSAPNAGGKYRVSGEGSLFYVQGHCVANDTGFSGGFEFKAEDGGRIVAGANGTFYASSADAANPLRLTAVDGGSITVGAGRWQTYWGSNVVATVKNGGVLRTPDGDSNSGLCNSEVYVADGTISCKLLQAYSYNNRVVFTSEGGSGTNTVVSGVDLLETVKGMTAHDNTITVKNCVLKGGNALVIGTNNTFIVDSSVVSTDRRSVFDSPYSKGSKLVFRGEAPKFVCSWQQSGNGATVGSATSSEGLPVIRFEFGSQPYEEAPFWPAADKFMYFYEYLPIEVKVGSNWLGNRHDVVPLISTWRISGTKPTAEAIESHLPERALPEGAHLVWNDNVLCVTGVKAPGGLVIVVR